MVCHDIRDEPCVEGTAESGRLKGALRVWPRSTTDVSTFPPGVSRSDEIPHVSHVVIKVMTRFSRSVKAFYG